MLIEVMVGSPYFRRVNVAECHHACARRWRVCVTYLSISLSISLSIYILLSIYVDTEL